MIRIAHFSDLHYGTKNQAEADRCFGAAIDRAIALGVEAAVLSGDATDHALDLHAPGTATGRPLPGADVAGHVFA